MLVRMPKVGSGVDGDPYTVIMPTWRWVADGPSGQTMIVSIPDDDAPDDTDAPGTARFPIVNGVPILVGLTLIQRAKWRTKLGRRWQAVADYSQVDVG